MTEEGAEIFSLKSSRYKTEGAHHSGGEEKSPLSGPGSELRLGREKEKEQVPKR